MHQNILWKLQITFSYNENFIYDIMPTHSFLFNVLLWFMLRLNIDDRVGWKRKKKKTKAQTHSFTSNQTKSFLAARLLTLPMKPIYAFSVYKFFITMSFIIHFANSHIHIDPHLILRYLDLDWTNLFWVFPRLNFSITIP